MSRLKISDLLSAVKTEIETRFDVTPTIRLRRADSEHVELSESRRFYLEPGALTVERVNCASPSVRQTIRFLSEAKTDYVNVDDALRDVMNFFERVSRDFMKTPRLDCGAFVIRTSTFADAPSGFSVSPIDAEIASVYGGIEITLVQD